jgi:hypothetical protein
LFVETVSLAAQFVESISNDMKDCSQHASPKTDIMGWPKFYSCKQSAVSQLYVLLFFRSSSCVWTVAYSCLVGDTLTFLSHLSNKVTEFI